MITNKNEDEDQTRFNEVGVPLIRSEEWGEPNRRPVLFTPLTKPIELHKAWYNEDPKTLPLKRNSNHVQTQHRNNILQKPRKRTKSNKRRLSPSGKRKSTTQARERLTKRINKKGYKAEIDY